MCHVQHGKMAGCTLVISPVLQAGSNVLGSARSPLCTALAWGKICLERNDLSRGGIHLQCVPSNISQTMHCTKEAFLINVL